MNIPSEFFEVGENELGEQFIKNGFFIQPVENQESLDQIHELVAATAGKFLGIDLAKSEEFLNNIHKEVGAARLNDLRLSVISRLNTDIALRPSYFSLARKLLAALVGNELAMQLRLNLSIQLPGDDSSLLPVHADVWSGDSPYEVVAWLPLVDCYRTKSMFLLPPEHAQSLHERFSDYREKSSENLYQDIKANLKWVEIKYGEILVFNQNLPHGNRVNEEDETRWSLNCRFKSVFSPYGDKKLGEFFEPVTLRPASRLGMHYRYPKTKD